MYLIMKTPEVSGDKTRFYCVQYDTFKAFEYVNVKFTGTTDTLSSKNSKFNVLSSSTGGKEKSTFSSFVSKVPRFSAIRINRSKYLSPGWIGRILFSIMIQGIFPQKSITA